MSTITQILKDFIIEKNPMCIRFSAVQTKGDNDNRRNNLYLAYAIKNIPSDYEIIKADNNSNRIRKKITKEIVNTFKTSTDSDELAFLFEIYPEAVQYVKNQSLLNDINGSVLVDVINAYPNLINKLNTDYILPYYTLEIIKKHPELIPKFNINIYDLSYYFEDFPSIIKHLSLEQKNKAMKDFIQNYKYLKDESRQYSTIMLGNALGIPTNQLK
jgi:hypothetical protein